MMLLTCNSEATAPFVAQILAMFTDVSSKKHLASPEKYYLPGVENEKGGVFVTSYFKTGENKIFDQNRGCG